ncbi:hypothetical protein J3459_010215 [Metarhizium acridum]|nr:hypothetical protein J3459_010215 [Metarhizium acridum]
MTLPQQLPGPGADPVAHAVAASPIPQTIFLVLFCLFIAIFIRITHFTLCEDHEYAVTRGLRCQHRQGHGPSSSGPNREVTAGWTSVGFDALGSPRCSLYMPNPVSANNAHGDGISAPLLARQEYEEHIESVEMDSVAVKAEEDWEDCSPLHGSNNLNTP